MPAFTKSSENSHVNSLSKKAGGTSFFGIQAKLSIGKPNDKYEKEADSVADKVVTKSTNQDSFFGSESFFPSIPSIPNVQKSRSEEVQKQEDSEEIQEKPLAESITPVVQLATEDEEIQQQANDKETLQEKCSSTTMCESKLQTYLTNESKQAKRPSVSQKTSIAPDNSDIQLQQATSTQNSCRDLEPSERRQIRGVLRAGARRMGGYLTHPEELIGPNQSQEAHNNIRTHIEATIQLTQDLIREISSGAFSFCIISNGCHSSANACFIPFDNQIRLEPFLLNRINADNVGAIVHEYKHYRQNKAHAEQAVNLDQVYRHTPLAELNQEYEGAVAGEIFRGYRLSAAPQSGTIVEADGTRNNLSGSNTDLDAIPRESIEFATQHASGIGPSQRSDLPQLNSGYSQQIARNRNNVLYPAAWNPRTQIVMIHGENNTRIPLNQINRSSIDSNHLINRAFWSNSAASSLYQSGQRTILVIHHNGTILNEVLILRQTLRANQPRQVPPSDTHANPGNIRIGNSPFD